MKRAFPLVAILLVTLAAFTVPAAAAPNDDEDTGRKAVSIKAPRVVWIGESVEITVVDRESGRPVSRAGVWAVAFNHTENAPLPVASSVMLDEETGIFLGWTDHDGRVAHIFEGGGSYLLIAFKDGHIPGFARMYVQSTRQLGIRAPASAVTGEPVTMAVMERGTGRVVAGAGVWALLADDLTIAPSTKDTVTITTEREDLVDIAMKRGIFLGRTNDDGQVTHKFDKAGGYYLVAVKDGYTPGLGKITIKPSIRPTAKPLPLSQSGALKPVTVKPQSKAAESVNIRLHYLLELVKKMVTSRNPEPDSTANQLNTDTTKVEY